MFKLNKVLFFIVIAVFATAVGLVYKLQKTGSALSLSESAKQAGAARFFDTTLPSPDGTAQAMTQWRGKVIVVNFWATWCPPCRDEIPELIEAYNTYHDKNLIVVGIAADNAEKVAAFSQSLNINYPIVIGNVDVFSLAAAMGNPMGALPFTVTIDRNGTIVDAHLGRIRKAQLEALITPLL